MDTLTRIWGPSALCYPALNEPSGEWGGTRSSLAAPPPRTPPRRRPRPGTFLDVDFMGLFLPRSHTDGPSHTPRKNHPAWKTRGIFCLLEIGGPPSSPIKTSPPVTT